MALRDPLAQLTEEEEIAQMLGPKTSAPAAAPKPYQPPGPGMSFGTGKPFRFNDLAPDPKAAINAQFANTGDPFEDKRQRRITDIADQGQHAEGAEFVNVGPAKRLGMGRQDAMALRALDPRALDEANKMAEMDEATPATMYAKVGGKEFYGVPGQRVDRNALARLYSKYQEKQGQERQDSVRAQEQGGKERLVGIPGQQLNERDKYRVDSDERMAGKSLDAAAPMRAADIAAKGAQTAAAVGGEARASAEAAGKPNQDKIALLERFIAGKRASPDAATLRGRNDIMAAEKLLASMAGVDLPSALEQGANPNDQSAEIDAAWGNDPEVKALIKEAVEGGQQLAAPNAGKSGWGNPLNVLGYTPESQITDIEGKVDRAIQAMLRKNPNFNEDAVRERMRRKLESTITGDSAVGRRLRKSTDRKPAP